MRVCNIVGPTQLVDPYKFYKYLVLIFCVCQNNLALCLRKVKSLEIREVGKMMFLSDR
jgi:hypothetical protein